MEIMNLEEQIIKFDDLVTGLNYILAHSPENNTEMTFYDRDLILFKEVLQSLNKLKDLK